MSVASRMSFYGDESGSHHDGPFVLSGYLGSDDTWDQISEQWLKILRSGTPIEYFHMRECYKLEGQFEGFNRFQADRKLNNCVDVIAPFLRRRALTEFTSVMDWDIYDRAVSGPVKDLFHNPYLFMIGAITAEVTKHLLKSGEGPVYFFLDDQIPLIEHDAAKMFTFSQATLEPELATLLDGQSYRSDKYCDPLQAADLISWQRHRRELSLSEDHGGSSAYKRLHNASREHGKLFRWREDGLVAFCRRVNDGLRQAGLLS